MTLTIPGIGPVDLDTLDAIHLRDELTEALARELPGGALVDDERDLHVNLADLPVTHGIYEGYSLSGRDKR